MDCPCQLTLVPGVSPYFPKNAFRFITPSCLPQLTWLWPQKKALSKSFLMVYILTKFNVS